MNATGVWVSWSHFIFQKGGHRLAKVNQRSWNGTETLFIEIVFLTFDSSSKCFSFESRCCFEPLERSRRGLVPTTKRLSRLFRVVSMSRTEDPLLSKKKKWKKNWKLNSHFFTFLVVAPFFSHESLIAQFFLRLFLAPSSNLSLFLNKRSCFSRTRTFFFALALRCARLTDLRRFLGLTLWRKPDACFMRPPPWKKSSAYVVVVVVDVDADADARVPRNLTQQNRLCWLAPSEKGPSGVCPNAENVIPRNCWRMFQMNGVVNDDDDDVGSVFSRNSVLIWLQLTRKIL